MKKELPDQYPNGNKKIKVPKYTSTEDTSKSSKRKTGPLVSWAARTVNSRSGKRQCLGITKCSTPGCTFREKPRVPRYGKKDTSSKYSTNGAAQKSKLQYCKVHPTSPMIHDYCDCTWTIIDKGDHWIIDHEGTHDHLVPPATQAHPNSVKILENHMRTAPELKPSQLATGRHTRPPMRDVDPAFINPDRLSSVMKKIKKKINKEISGSETATQSLDAAFQFFRSEKEFSETILDSCFVGRNKEPYIIFMTPEMREVCQNPSHIQPGWQTDTIEAFVESQYYRGRIQVTMTSCFCDVLGKMFPIFMSILFSKDAVAYKEHWRAGVKVWGEGRDNKFTSVDEFNDKFPGNTSDFSGSILNGWQLAVNEALDKLTDNNEELTMRH